MYGLPHAGKIAQDVHIEHLASHRYHQTGTMIYLFRPAINGVAFTLVVDDFGVKFQDLTGAEDLIHCLQLYYKLIIKMAATFSWSHHRCRSRRPRSTLICPRCHPQSPQAICSPLNLSCSLACSIPTSSLRCRCTSPRIPRYLSASYFR